MFTNSDNEELRARAVTHLKKKRDLLTHALVFALFNTFFVAIWAFTSDGGFFWPMFPMAGWGIGLAMNAWDVYRPEEFSEDQIKREMNRLQGAH